MSSVFKSVLLLCLMAASPLVGCDASGGGGGEGGQGGGPEPTRVSLRLHVFELHPDQSPVEGAGVCELETENCVMSDRQGIAVLGLPANQEIAFTVEKEGYGPWLFANVTDDNFPPTGTAAMASHAQLAAIAEDLGVAYPWENGMVGLQRWFHHDGVRFVPVGPTADEVGAGFYLAEMEPPSDPYTNIGRYSLELEATKAFPTAAEFPLAQGGFVDVEAGIQQFEFSGNMEECFHAGWAWPGDAPNRIRIPVRAGYLNYGGMWCDAWP